MEDIKKIQEFFSKPLNENKVTKEDFDKVVKILSKSKYPFTIMLVPKWDEIDIITGQDSPDEIVDDIGQRLDSAGLNWGGNSGITISGDSSNYSRREYSDIFRVNGGHQDYFEEGVNEMDMNDPILMKMRAAKDKLAKMRAANAGDDGNDKFFRNAKKIAFLKKEREQLMRDMEQEAEPEGGPIADEYGSKLNRIDAAIAKLSGRKEMTYDQAIAEGEGKMPTQDQVDRFFELTQNETHYLNSKPVAGQEATFNLMKIEPWDEYDLSNWNSLVRKAKAKGKSIAENNSYVRVSEPKFIKDKNNPNFLYVNFKYDTGGGVLTALGKETMAGQIRRLSSAEAMKQATALAKDLEAKYNLEDIDVYDKENGVVQIFAVSDDFIDMDPGMLGEIKESLNPEVSNALNRFIKAMAKRYDYSEQDAVYAIMAALKQRDFDGVNEAKEEDKIEFKRGNTVFDKHTKAKLKVTRIVKDRIYTVPFNFPGRAEEWYKAEDLTTKSFFTEQKEDKIDIVTMDVPLFIRALEYAKEDAQEDMDLHDFAEKAIAATKEQGILQMDDYDMLVGELKQIGMEENMSLDDEAKAYYLAKVKRGEIDTLPEDPKAAFLAQMTKDQIAHDKETLRKERGLEEKAAYIAETIKLGEGVIEEELCPKGKAYIKRRKAAGEKSSAYLSGRAVKVCKGQMSGRKKKK